MVIGNAFEIFEIELKFHFISHIANTELNYTRNSLIISLTIIINNNNYKQQS